jgi:hypothetical protein
VVALGAFLMGFACLAHNAARARLTGMHPDGVEILLGTALIGGAWAVFLLAQARRVHQAALCSGVLMMAALLSVTEFLTAPAPAEVGEALARGESKPTLALPSGEAFARLPSDAWIVTAGLPKHVRAAMLLAGGRRVYGLTDSDKPEEEARCLREFLKEPSPKYVIMDSRDYRALPGDLRQAFIRIGEASGTEERDFPKWLHTPPRSLQALILGTQQELWLLRAGGQIPQAAS